MTTTTAAAVIQDVTGDYQLDASHTRLGFVARHAMVTKVRGNFETFEGSAHLDAQEPTRSSATLTIDVASIQTGQAQRDGHLRTNDFFDVPTFPQMTFTSTAVEAAGGDTYRMTGDLTIKGVTKSITIDFEYSGSATDPYGNLRVGFEGRTTINRSDWGVSFNAALAAGGLLVSEKITLEFDVSAIKVVPTA